MKLFFAAINKSLIHNDNHYIYKNNWQRFHIDLPLMTGLSFAMGIGFILLYSASNGDHPVIIKQMIRLVIGIMLMLSIAQFSAAKFRNWTPWCYLLSVGLLVVVLGMGSIANGAQRWIDLGFFNFQPSELMKLTVPMMVAWYFSQSARVANLKSLVVVSLIILLPTLLIIKQPDLGTAITVLMGGCCVILFSGLRWRYLMSMVGLLALATPVLFKFMHSYQLTRLFSFLNPEADPLGHGYHIIQSKIAIGSGGLWGKGWLNGSQGKLNYVPEDATDFIFVVLAEEFGLIGCTVLIIAFLTIIARCFYIAYQAQDTFSRLLVSSFGLVFFLSVVINIGMVVGLFPVVGLPLPLVSYGGTSLVVMMVGFGMIMSIQTHRKFN